MLQRTEIFCMHLYAYQIPTDEIAASYDKNCVSGGRKKIPHQSVKVPILWRLKGEKIFVI
jgi:hypothetical protein